MKELTEKVKEVSTFLGEKQFLGGDRVTYADFLVCETLDWFKLFSPSILEPYENLKAYVDRFEQLPAIKKYKNSDSYKDWPISGAIMNWGFKK